MCGGLFGFGFVMRRLCSFRSGGVLVVEWVIHRQKLIVLSDT